VEEAFTFKAAHYMNWWLHHLLLASWWPTLSDHQAQIPCGLIDSEETPAFPQFFFFGRLSPSLSVLEASLPVPGRSGNED
jgi:hypothetical protein